MAGKLNPLIGFRKIILAFVILLLATMLLCFRFISQEIWSHIADITCITAVGGNVLSNLGGALGKIFGGKGTND